MVPGCKPEWITSRPPPGDFVPTGRQNIVKGMVRTLIVTYFALDIEGYSEITSKMF